MDAAAALTGEDLSFAFVSSDASVASFDGAAEAAHAGAATRLRGEAAGSARITVTATNPGGAASVTFAVAVTAVAPEPMPRAWLSRFGRAAADRTVEAISRRVNEGPRESHLTLGGGGLDRLLALGGGPDDAGDESPDAASAAAEILFAEQNNVDRLRALSLDYVSGNRGGGFAAGAGRIGGGMGGMNFAAGSGGGNFASGAGMGNERTAACRRAAWAPASAWAA